MLEKAKRNREEKDLADLTNLRIKLLESVKDILPNSIYLVRLPEKLETAASVTPTAPLTVNKSS